jgi:acyl-ACP thioesterase
MTGREADSCSAPYRVRFDEAGPDGRLRTSVLLRYAQDLAWFHSAARGFDRAWYAEHGLTWLVRTAAIAVDAAALVGSELVGTTRVVGARRVWARRRTDFVDAAGELVALVNIDWVLLDRRGAPTRIPADFDHVFGMTHEPIELGRVDLQDEPPDAVGSTFRVRPQELDPMDHVNNAVYADWLDEAVIACGGRESVWSIPRVARLEYARAAESDSTVETATWHEPDGSWACRISDAGGADLLRARLSASAASPGTG